MHVSFGDSGALKHLLLLLWIRVRVL